MHVTQPWKTYGCCNAWEAINFLIFIIIIIVQYWIKEIKLTIFYLQQHLWQCGHSSFFHCLSLSLSHLLLFFVRRNKCYSIGKSMNESMNENIFAVVCPSRDETTLRGDNRSFDQDRFLHLLLLLINKSFNVKNNHRIICPWQFKTRDRDEQFQRDLFNYWMRFYLMIIE